VISKATAIIFVLIVLSVAGWWAHDKYRDTTEANARKKHRTALQEQFKSATVAAAKRHDAIIDWEKGFEAAPFSEPFSIQLQDILVSAKPIVIDEGLVQDVARHEGRSYLYLNDYNITGVTMHFVLECDAADVRRIVERKEAFVSVIAKIESVEKAQVALRSGGKTSDDTEPVEVHSSSLFVAHGKCLEILFSGE
jgi:hypothetical protein